MFAPYLKLRRSWRGKKNSLSSSSSSTLSSTIENQSVNQTLSHGTESNLIVPRGSISSWRGKNSLSSSSSTLSSNSENQSSNQAINQPIDPASMLPRTSIGNKYERKRTKDKQKEWIGKEVNFQKFEIRFEDAIEHHHQRSSEDSPPPPAVPARIAGSGIARSSRVEQPKRMDSASVIYYDSSKSYSSTASSSADDSLGWGPPPVENSCSSVQNPMPDLTCIRTDSPPPPPVPPRSTSARNLNGIKNNDTSNGTTPVKKKAPPTLPKTWKEEGVGGDKRRSSTGPDLKAIQKRAVLEFYLKRKFQSSTALPATVLLDQDDDEYENEEKEGKEKDSDDESDNIEDYEKDKEDGKPDSSNESSDKRPSNGIEIVVGSGSSESSDVCTSDIGPSSLENLSSGPSPPPPPSPPLSTHPKFNKMHQVQELSWSSEQRYRESLEASAIPFKIITSNSSNGLLDYDSVKSHLIRSQHQSQPRIVKSCKSIETQTTGTSGRPGAVNQNLANDLNLYQENDQNHLNHHHHHHHHHNHNHHSHLHYPEDEKEDNNNSSDLINNNCIPGNVQYSYDGLWPEIVMKECSELGEELSGTQLDNQMIKLKNLENGYKMDLDTNESFGSQLLVRLKRIGMSRVEGEKLSDHLEGIEMVTRLLLSLSLQFSNLSKNDLKEENDEKSGQMKRKIGRIKAQLDDAIGLREGIERRSKVIKEKIIEKYLGEEVKDFEQFIRSKVRLIVTLKKIKIEIDRLDKLSPKN